MKGPSCHLLEHMTFRYEYYNRVSEKGAQWQEALPLNNAKKLLSKQIKNNCYFLVRKGSIYQILCWEMSLCY